MSAVALLAAVLAGQVTGQVTERVSVDSSGAQGNGDCGESSISADGRYVAFGSEATDLVSGDTNSRFDVFVRDRSSAPPGAHPSRSATRMARAARSR